MKFILFLALIASGNLFCTAPDIIQQAESYSAGKLSESNEAFIRNVIAQAQCANTTIELRKPTQEMIELYPIYIFGNFVASYNYWYINEKWFSGLSDAAKKFYLGYQLIAPKPAGALEKLPNIIVWVIEFLILVALFMYLRKRQTIGKYTLTNSKRVGLAFLGMFLSALPIEYIEQKLFVPTTIDILLKHDLTVVEKLNCIDGAIELLKNQQAIIAPLYEHDKAYWSELYESLPKRLAQLEKLRNSQV